MKIKRDNVCFGDLKVGDSFEFCNEIYIKVSLAGRNNAFNLSGNILCSFNDDYVVTKLQAELSIR